MAFHANGLMINEEGHQDFDEIQEIEAEIKKVPPMIARQYQLDLCRKAWSGNEDLESSSHFKCSDEEDTRREVLHEIRVPTVLREPRSKAENHVKFSSYFVKFRPQPADSDYRPFGLFVQVSLPGEVEIIKTELDVSTDLPRAKCRSSFILSASPGRDTLTNSPKGL